MKLSRSLFVLLLFVLPAVSSGATDPIALELTKRNIPRPICLTKQERVRALEETITNLKERYALWSLKSMTLKHFYNDPNYEFDSDKHAETALATEKATNDICAKSGVTVENIANSNLEFRDRFTAFTAAFCDSHFSASSLPNEKYSMLPIYFVQADGKVRLDYVSGNWVYILSNVLPLKVESLSAIDTLASTVIDQDKDLSSRIEMIKQWKQIRPDDKSLKTLQSVTGQATLAQAKRGDEVLSIDGVDIEKVIADISKFIGRSSPGAVRSRAIDKLTSRNFLYPRSPIAKIKLRSQDPSIGVYELSLPWLYSGMGAENSVHVLSTGSLFNLISQFLMTNKEIKEHTIAGYDLTNMGENLSKTESYYFNDDGSISELVKVGFYVQNKHKFAFLGIYSFDFNASDHLLIADKKGSMVDSGKDFADILRAFLKLADTQKLPLILDLRSNGGGDPTNRDLLISLLLQPGEEKQTMLISFTTRLYSKIKQLISDEAYLTYSDGVLPAHDSALIFSSISLAEREGREFSYFLHPVGTLSAERVKGGFSGAIAALIGPECVSACDGTAHLLGFHKRAVLIGTPTNGTGASSGDDIPTSQGLLGASAISYRLFALPPDESQGDRQIMNSPYLWDRPIERYTVENQPAQPDIKYESTLEDLDKNNLGWLKEAARVLGSQN